MLITAPACNRGPRSYKSPVDNGEGSSKGATKAEKRGVEKHFYIGESVPRVEIPCSKNCGKGKNKANSEDSKEKAPSSDAPARPKGKKPGPKAWTALESEGVCLSGCGTGQITDVLQLRRTLESMLVTRFPRSSTWRSLGRSSRKLGETREETPRNIQMVFIELWAGVLKLFVRQVWLGDI
jgi:hypothetical protein